jgi:hypothetical protein
VKIGARDDYRPSEFWHGSCLATLALSKRYVHYEKFSCPQVTLYVKDTNSQSQIGHLYFDFTIRVSLEKLFVH